MSKIQFGIDDQVWSFKYKKWGKIVDIEEFYDPSIEVDFGDETIYWCDKGDLFFEEIVIPESAKIRPQPKHVFKPGDVVLARQACGLCLLVVNHVLADGLILQKIEGRYSYEYAKINIEDVQPYDSTLIGFGVERNEI